MRRLYCLCWYLTTVKKDRKTYTHTETLEVPSTSCKRFVNFSALNHWVVCGQFTGSGWMLAGTFALFFARVYWLIFTELSAVSGLYNSYWNRDGLLKGRCYGNQFVARVGENWHPVVILSGIQQPLRELNCNIDYGINIADNRSTSGGFFYNFGPAISEILQRVCRGWVGARG